jgi:hypothetical protein
MALILGGICVSVLCLSTVIWIKRTTGRREMEPHSITARWASHVVSNKSRGTSL